MASAKAGPIRMTLSLIVVAAALAHAGEDRDAGRARGGEVSRSPRADHGGRPAGSRAERSSGDAIVPAQGNGDAATGAESPRPRARALGLRLGVMTPGSRNDITDVEGVRVGHFTLRSEPRFNTGITAVLPHGGNIYLEKVPAAIVVGNGFGKLAGSTQVNELGEIETPVLLTGTLNVPRVADALITYMLSLPGMEDVRSINPVVGETNDGFLSDGRARPLGEEEVRAAIEAARPGPIPMGAVGAGTGTVCFGFKGGIGSASRRLDGREGGWTVGVLVQSNFGGPLRLGGLPLHVEGTPLGGFLMRSAAETNAPPAGSAGRSTHGGGAAHDEQLAIDARGERSVTRVERSPDLSETSSSPEVGPPTRPIPQFHSAGGSDGSPMPGVESPPSDGGSLMIVIATDAPLDHRNLRRLAARSLYGMALTGGYGANGSGDYAIAFSTHEKLRIRRGDLSGAVERPLLVNDAASRLFQAVTEATEEAIVDSLFTAHSVRGHIGSVPALPVEKVLELVGAPASR